MADQAEQAAPEYTANDMQAAMKIVAPKLDSRKGPRKARQKKQAASGDGRSLRATGRTSQANFMIKPELLALFNKHVDRGQRAVAHEEALIMWLKSKRGVDFDVA